MEPSIVSMLSGLVSRTWRVGPRHVAVQLTHNTITGSRVVSVDGEEVGGSEGSFTPFSKPLKIAFTVDGYSGYVTLEAKGMNCLYRCMVSPPGGGDITALPEDNQVMAGAQGGSEQEAANKLRVSVEAAEEGVAENGEPIQYYRIKVVRESDGRTTLVHRRFRDFHSLNDALRAAYCGSQLLGSFPQPPPRGFKVLENHADAAFVERRRWLLADFLYKLEGLPRMRQNADFRTFTGLVDGARETSCFFPAGAPLGLTLGAGAGGTSTVVMAIKPMPNGAPSPAAAIGVMMGCQISKINGEDVLGTPHDSVVARLKTAPRPLLIHFIQSLRGGGTSAVPDSPAPAAAAAPMELSAFAPTPAPLAAASAGQALFMGSSSSSGSAPPAPPTVAAPPPRLETLALTSTGEQAPPSVSAPAEGAFEDLI